MVDESKTEKVERCLLISMPTLTDPNFSHTTSLISEFNDQGAMGLILNRPLNLNLNQVIQTNLASESTARVKVYWGGPVQTERGWILHEDESLAADSIQIESGLFLSNSLASLTRLIEATKANDPRRYRFFLGYAGWGNGQLEREMAASSWVTAPLNRELLFDHSPETLWERSLASIGVEPSKLAGYSQTVIH